MKIVIYPNSLLEKCNAGIQNLGVEMLTNWAFNYLAPTSVKVGSNQALSYYDFLAVVKRL